MGDRYQIAVTILTLGAVTWLLLAAAAPAVAADANVRPSATELQKPQRQLSPGAQSRDPHWRPGPVQRSQASRPCPGVDLVASCLEVKAGEPGAGGTGTPIMIRACWQNRCTGTVSGNPSVTYEIIGGQSAVWVGYRGTAPTPGGTWLRLGTSKRHGYIRVRATINQPRSITESNYDNNSCTVRYRVNSRRTKTSACSRP